MDATSDGSRSDAVVSPVLTAGMTCAAMGQDSEADWPLHTRWIDRRIPATPSSIASVRDALAELGLPQPILDDARLLVTELLTNSIRHAGLADDELVRIRAEWSASGLRVDVWDPTDAAAPSPLPGPASDGESGWGLHLVDSVASRWGAAPGWHWFELTREPGAG